MKPKDSLHRISRRRFTAGSFTAAAMASLAACGLQPTGPAPKRASPLDGPLPEPNGLNLIVICADTTRADHLGCYGSQRVKSPSLDQFARQSVVFENSYADGLPTIPCRRVFFTGRTILHEEQPWWRPLNDDDVTLPMVLRKAGYHTGFVTDVYHYMKAGLNFQQGFDSFEFIRGQEMDAWVSGPRDAFDPAGHMPPHHLDQRYLEGMRQYMMNTAGWKREDDYFAAQVCRAAMTWLDRSARQKPFFLWVDSFDPHEPWDAPLRYQKMYRDEYGYERYLFGYPVDTGKVRAEEYPLIADLYAAEVTFTDHWIGRLLEKIEQLGLLDDTIVVFASDHGTHLGEQGCLQKTAGLLNSAVARLPLVVRHPERSFGGKRVSGFTGAVDYMPTFLTMLGLEGLSGMDGENFWRLAESEGAENSQRRFMGFGNFGAVRDGQWHYFQNYRGEESGKGPALYDIESDPREEKNVAAEHPGVVAEMRGLLADRFQVELPTTRPT